MVLPKLTIDSGRRFTDAFLGLWRLRKGGELLGSVTRTQAGNHQGLPDS